MLNSNSDALVLASNNFMQQMEAHLLDYQSSWERQTEMTLPLSKELEFLETSEPGVQEVVHIYQTLKGLINLSEELIIAYCRNSRESQLALPNKVQEHYRLVVSQINNFAKTKEPFFESWVQSESASQALFWILINLKFQHTGKELSSKLTNELFTHLNKHQKKLPVKYQRAYHFLFDKEINPVQDALSFKAIQEQLALMVKESSLQAMFAWLDSCEKLNFISELPLFLEEYLRAELTNHVASLAISNGFIEYDIRSREPSQARELFSLMSRNRHLMRVESTNPCIIGQGENELWFYPGRLFKKWQLQGTLFHFQGQFSKEFKRQSDAFAELFFLTLTHNITSNYTPSEKEFIQSLTSRYVEKLEAHEQPFITLSEIDLWAQFALSYLDNLMFVTPEFIARFYQRAPNLVKTLMPTKYLIVAEQVIRNVAELNSVMPFNEKETEESLTFYMKLLEAALAVTKISMAMQQTEPSNRAHELSRMLDKNSSLLPWLLTNQTTLVSGKFSFLNKAFPALINQALAEFLNDEIITTSEPDLLEGLNQLQEACLINFDKLGCLPSYKTQLESLFTSEAEKKRQEEDRQNGWDVTPLIAHSTKKNNKKKRPTKESKPKAEPTEARSSKEELEMSDELASLIREDEERIKAKKEAKKAQAELKRTKNAGKSAKETLEQREERKKQERLADIAARMQSPVYSNKVKVERSVFPDSFLELVDFLNEIEGVNLFLVGGAVASLYLREPLESINDFDCLALNIPVEALCELLNKSEAFKGKAKIVGKDLKRHIEIELSDGKGGTYKVDINTIAHPGPDKIRAVSQYLKKVDFKLAALFVELVGDPFIIQGVAGALASIDAKRIALIHNSRKCFEEDPVCLLRLCKLMFKYSDFPLDDGLKKVLKDFSSRDPCTNETGFSKLFEDFIGSPEKTREQGQMNTALLGLLSRFSAEAVFDQLHALGILEGLTGFSEQELYEAREIYFSYLADSSDSLTALEKKERLYMVLSAIYLKNNGSSNFNTWTFHRMSSWLSRLNSFAYEDMKHRICEEPVGAVMYTPAYRRMIVKVQEIPQKESAVAKEHQGDQASSALGNCSV